MTIMSLKDFVQQAGKRQESRSREVFVVTVRDFLNAIETNYEDDWTVNVTWDCPELNSLVLRFIPTDDTE